MNRADVLAKITTLRKEKALLIGVVMDRFDAEMGDAPVKERQETLLYGGIYTIDERERLSDLEVKINGYTHMLSEGFFKPEQAPEEEKEEPLY